MLGFSCDLPVISIANRRCSNGTIFMADTFFDNIRDFPANEINKNKNTPLLKIAKTFWTR